MSSGNLSAPLNPPSITATLTPWPFAPAECLSSARMRATPSLRVCCACERWGLRTKATLGSSDTACRDAVGTDTRIRLLDWAKISTPRAVNDVVSMVAATPAAGTKMTTIFESALVGISLAAGDLASSHSALSILGGPTGLAGATSRSCPHRGTTKRRKRKIWRTAIRAGEPCTTRMCPASLALWCAIKARVARL